MRSQGRQAPPEAVDLLFLGPLGLESEGDPLAPCGPMTTLDGLGFVGGPCHPEFVRVTEADVAAVPVGNLRVPRADFGVLWSAAERLCDEQGGRGVTDWYAAGVAVTCRWLAATVVQDATGRRRPAHAPVTRRTRRAYEELIEAEYLAAEQLDLRHPEWLAERPGWSEAVRATLRWAWRHSGPPPLQLTVDAAG